MGRWLLCFCRKLGKFAVFQKSYDAITDEILRLQQMKKQAQTDDQDRKEIMNRVKELQDFIKKEKTKITDFDESQVKTLIQRITLFPGCFVVEFKSGASVDIME